MTSRRVRSFRAEIARRVAVAVGALLASVAILSIYVLGRLLENDLDRTLLRIAEVEAEATASSTGASFQFQAVLLGSRDPILPELARYAQLLARDGTVLLRSRNMGLLHLGVPSEALAQVQGGGIAWATHHRPGGERFRSLLYPLSLVGADPGDFILQVTAPYLPITETVGAFTWFLGILFIGATAVAFVMGWRGASVALRPTRDIAAQAEALEVGSLSARITAHENVAEFRQLVRVLNAMLDRLERAFESQRRFTADASHELRAPLNVLRGELEVALKRPRTEPEYRIVLERCRGEVLRLSQLAEDLLTLARADAGALIPRPGLLDLYEVADAVVARYRPLAAERSVALALDGGTVWLRGDAGLLERAVENLVANAIKHTPPGGRVSVAVGTSDPATVVVRDTGPGIPPEHVAQVFDRFFQANPARPRARGTGLGLSIARAAAEVHGGSLTFEGNSPGAVFRLAVPIAVDQPTPVVGAATER